MCTLAADQTSTWLMVDTWEAFQDYQRTAVVLDHFDYEINTVLGGIHTGDGEQRNVKVMLLAGSDLISTMSEPGVWSYADVGLRSSIPSPSVDRLWSGSWITYWDATAHSLLNAKDREWTKQQTALQSGETTFT
jgi:hypothetical protein